MVLVIKPVIVLGYFIFRYEFEYKTPMLGALNSFKAPKVVKPTNEKTLI